MRILNPAARTWLCQDKNEKGAGLEDADKEAAP